MKRIALVALALALLPGLAIAQNITKSLQGSQDPRGPVGLDTSNSAYFPGHINAFGQSPATSLSNVAGCGVGAALNVGSTDTAGTIKNGAVNTCQLFFGSPFNQPPACMATEQGTGSATTSIVIQPTTTQVSFFGITQSTSFSYICIGNQ